MTSDTRVVLIMGVAGAGKTTLGQALASELGWAFEDADAYHSAASERKMAAGQGLTDTDRAPWLDALAALVRERVEDGPPTVLACSALKAAYRARLGADRPEVEVVWLDVPAAVLRERLAARRGHPVGPSLLPSQLSTLEPPADAVRVDATRPLDHLVGVLTERLGS